MSDPAGGLLWPLPFPQLAALLGYWQDKRGRRRCPDKADIDPAEIPRLLPNIVLIDAAAEGGECRYRLAGTRASEMMGKEVRGKTLGELHNHTSDRALLREIARVEREFAWIARSFAGGFRTTTLAVPGREHVQAARLALPLGDAGGRAAQVLMMLVDISSSPLAVRKAGATGFGIDLDVMAPIPYPPEIAALSTPDYVWAWGARL
jgi:hypothetical protein